MTNASGPLQPSSLPAAAPTAPRSARWRPRPGAVVGAVVTAVVAALFLATLRFDLLSPLVPGGAAPTMQVPFAQLIALRGLLVVGLTLAFFITAFFAVRRSLTIGAGKHLGVLALVLAVCAASHGAVLYSRGYVNPGMLSVDRGMSVTRPTGDVTVLVLNMGGSISRVEEVADLVERAGADIVVLPETTRDFGTQVANVLTGRISNPEAVPTFDQSVFEDQAVGARVGAFSLFQLVGRPAQLDAPEPDGPGMIGSTTVVLVSAAFGPYRIAETLEMHNGAAVLEPVTGTGPVVAALHAGAPRHNLMKQWRHDQGLLAQACRDYRDRPLLVAGTINATVDHATLGASPCTNLLQAAGAGAVGTWPVALPSFLAVPIDGVYGGTGDFQVREAGVVETKFADHRAVLVRLRPGR
ncbi:MAG: hypothetical protein Q4D69_06490 [Buchananella hordeovulneris]|nr:hypothetical protein [Buchananella hordeovulneris]